MRADWDLRAREDAYHFIDCGHGESPEEFWSSGQRDVEALILRGIDLSAQVDLLEIGCGVGRLLRSLAPRVRRVTGVDISGEMIRRGREELKDCANVGLLQTGGDLAGVPDRSIDFVFSCIVFQHIVSKAAVFAYLRESARVLRPGGLLRFQADGRPRRLRIPNTWTGVRFEAAELTRALDEHGLTVLEVRSPGTQYMWVTARNGAPAAAAPARLRARGWNTDALGALLGRLEASPGELARVLSLPARVEDLAGAFFRLRTKLAATEYVSLAYQAILGRPADPAGLEFYAREIREGIPRSNVVECLLASPEFDERYRASVEPEAP